MLRKILMVCGTIAALALVAAGLLALRAEEVVGRDYAHIPEPAIAADTSPEGIARGELLFNSLCIECHGGPDGRATGKRLDEVPAFLGRFWSANLAHPKDGVHARTDGQLARVLRSGVLPDGRLSVVMNGFGKIGDSDVAALLGYMRSGAPPFAAGGEHQPKTELSLAGKLIITYVAGLTVEAPVRRIPVPAKAKNADYGRYMATVMDCAGCHTAGFSSTKTEEPGAFAGGFELTDPTGAKIFTKNITFDRQTGIGGWSVDDFDRALTRGVRPDGYLVRKPMPLFSRLDRTDVEAIYLYLQTVPKVQRANTPGGHPLVKPHENDSAEVLFVNVGCAACHGDQGPYRDKLRGAIDKPDADVARWILDPQAMKPGSPMPSFERALDRGQAEKLAKYVKALARKHPG